MARGSSFSGTPNGLPAAALPRGSEPLRALQSGSGGTDKNPRETFPYEDIPE